jgi:hypothetical protein
VTSAAPTSPGTRVELDETVPRQPSTHSRPNGPSVGGATTNVNAHDADEGRSTTGP